MDRSKKSEPSEQYLFLTLVFLVASYIVTIVIYYLLSYIPLRRTSEIAFETIEDVDLAVDSACDLVVENPTILGIKIFPQKTIDRCKRVLASRDK